MFRRRNISRLNMWTALVLPPAIDYSRSMTYIADLDPNSPSTACAEAHAESFTAEDYAAEAYGVTILGERDFPLYNDNEDAERVPNDDWEAFMGSR